MAIALNERSVVVGWDFSTSAVKAVAFDLAGQVLAESRFLTDLWTADGVTEINLLMLEGQARASARGIAAKLHKLDRLNDWVAAGISATHHTASRIDELGNPIRRAICWNDQTLAKYHAEGEARLGGPAKVRQLLGGPWAERYSLSHLVKDETTLSRKDWLATQWMQPHGSLAAGYLTGRFDCISVSSAASTGLMNLRTQTWEPRMLGALANAEYRTLAEGNLPKILDMMTPVGPLSESIAADCGLPEGVRPLIFPTLDDQAAGLVGGGAVAAGHVAIILGNSAVVNSSFADIPSGDALDVMRLNWGPYLAMRCYNNGASFLNHVLPKKPNWDELERAASIVSAGCDGTYVLPFLISEPSVGVKSPMDQWIPNEPTAIGVRVRAVYESIAYLIALGLEAHRAAGQAVTQVTVSGGMARSELMCEILASVLNVKLERLVSDEGPALGAAVGALAGVIGGEPDVAIPQAVSMLVKFKSPMLPKPAWVPIYREGLEKFRASISS